MSRIGTVVSARSASKRLPRKALLNLGGVPMIQFLLDRLRDARLGGELIFATTTRADDDELARTVQALRIPVYRGADDDVVLRHLDLARTFELDWIVRITGDCPFVDAESLAHCLMQWTPDRLADIVSTKGVFPRGIDYELFSVATMLREWPRMSGAEKEHLTLRLYRRELGFVVDQFKTPRDWPLTQSSFTVDTPLDYEKATDWVARFGRRSFSIGDLLRASLDDACVG